MQRESYESYSIHYFRTRGHLGGPLSRRLDLDRRTTIAKDGRGALCAGIVRAVVGRLPLAAVEGEAEQRDYYTVNAPGKSVAFGLEDVERAL